MKLLRTVFIVLILSSAGIRVNAAEDSVFYSESKTLRLAVDANAFVKNNEFEGEITKGYTLPGFWIRPRATYAPNEKVHFELGAHAIVYDGASKYPNFAFHDIVSWKGKQYTSGMHIVPWLRAEARLKHTTITIGSLHRDEDFHNLCLPMFNPEIELSADPEQGVEVRVDLPHYKMDAWIDWQSFIFKNDNHQESFIFGLSQEFILTGKKSKRFRLSIPLQIMAQHRGGEIDDTNTGVETIINGAVGMKGIYLFPHCALNSLSAEAMLLHTWQQAGHLLTFNHGNAFWGSVKATLWNTLNCQVGIFHTKNYASIYGSPFFGTVSLTHKGGSYSRMTTGMVAVEYRYPLGKDFSIAVNGCSYLNNAGRFTHKDMTIEPTFFHSFELGVCFRANFDFILKNFNK